MTINTINKNIVIMKKQQQEKLFKQIITEHQDKIFRICNAYLYNKHNVEDLFQEVLVNIWNSLPRFKGQSQITTWIYRITLNTTITFNKAHTRKKNILTNNIPENIMDDSSGYEKEIQKQEQTDKLLTSIQKLEKDERLIISFVLEELAYKEIADILGISVNLVGVKINRIKKKLLRLYNG